MGTVAVAIVCKTPSAGLSKTRLSPPLSPDQCAALSGCFIRDLAATVTALSDDGDVTGVALYTPIGSQGDLSSYIPGNFLMVPQIEGGFGERLRHGAAELLAKGHEGAILVNSDSPTLPKAILRQAVDAIRTGDDVVLSPALDGGYTLIGLSRDHPRLFEDIPWSTSNVFRLTCERANELGLSLKVIPGWYDIDDASSLRQLIEELAGVSNSLHDLQGADAPSTRDFLLKSGALRGGICNAVD